MYNDIDECKVTLRFSLPSKINPLEAASGLRETLYIIDSSVSSPMTELVIIKPLAMSMTKRYRSQ